MNGFHLQERYIVVLYHMPAKQDAAAAKADLARREEELATLKKKHNIGDEWLSIVVGYRGSLFIHTTIWTVSWYMQLLRVSCSTVLRGKRPYRKMSCLKIQYVRGAFVLLLSSTSFQEIQSMRTITVIYASVLTSLCLTIGAESVDVRWILLRILPTLKHKNLLMHNEMATNYCQHDFGHCGGTQSFGWVELNLQLIKSHWIWRTVNKRRCTQERTLASSSG